MKGYSERKIYPDWALRAFRDATAIVNSIYIVYNEDDEKTIIRCHELARAVLPFLESNWKIIDGHYASIQHSWLVRDKLILDTYNAARLPMVTLIGGHWSSVELYRPGSLRDDIRLDIISVLNYEICMNGFQHKSPLNVQLLP